MSVKIRMRCNKISKQKHWNNDDSGNMQTQTTIDLAVHHSSDVNDPNYAYAQLSGGSVFPLTTINDKAANQFEIGKDYDIVITPSE